MNLLQLLGMGGQQSPQMGGAAGMAQQAIQSRPYQLHVQEAQAMGQQPLTPEQWMAQHSKPAPRGLLGG